MVETGPDEEILRFLEKPKPEDVPNLGTNTINAGIYVLEPTILDLIPKSESCSFEYNVFPAILEKKKPFFGYVLKDAYWRDLGNPKSYLQAHHDFFGGIIRGFEPDRSAVSDIATAAFIDKASVDRRRLRHQTWRTHRKFSVGPGVHVEEKAVIEYSVIWAHTRISGASDSRNAIVGRSCHIGRNVVVSEGAVLVDKASLPDYSHT